MASVSATPGVYIEEKSAFPNSAVPVATAVPAFIGYTKKATQDKKDLTNHPTRISSFGEYLLYFGDGPDTRYELTISADKQRIYELATKTDTRFLLYYSIKLFFANGGSDCYIVSIGNYDKAPTLADFNDEKPDLNGDIQRKGILTLLKEPEPTMLVIPDAVLLGADDCAALQQLMLAHCQKMASRISILDVFMDENAMIEPDTRKIVSDFRDKIGTNHLMWGAAYYPWVRTNIMGSDDVSYNNVDKGSWDNLIKLVSEEGDECIKEGLDKKRGESIKSEVKRIKTARIEAAKAPAEADADAAELMLHQTLLAISPLYKAIMTTIREKINLLPPSAGIAGIYSMVDNQIGVFQSPANVSFGSVIQPVVNITNDEQEDLNVPLNGKAVNAIRAFAGKGVLVWGARTLDGNSQDWRYVNVRRTVIFIEQSIKYATEPYVFAPNVSSTWTNIKAMITNFLTNVWQSGALAGAVPDDAFSVDVGLGATMTPVDILDGIMRITVKIAVTRPAEFIVITFQQKMQQS
jgi:phage tail sheath protein FI